MTKTIDISKELFRMATVIKNDFRAGVKDFYICLDNETLKLFITDKDFFEECNYNGFMKYAELHLVNKTYTVIDIENLLRFS